MVVSSLVFVYSHTAPAEYVQHQYFYMDMALDKCTQTVKTSAEKVGFKNIQIKTSKDDGFYTSLSSMNEEGYSFQFLCESKKGFGYLIINGLEENIRIDIKQRISKEIYNQK